MREQERINTQEEAIVFLTLSRKLHSHYFCCILFVRSKSISLSHTRGTQGVNARKQDDGGHPGGCLLQLRSDFSSAWYRCFEYEKQAEMEFFSDLQTTVRMAGGNGTRDLVLESTFTRLFMRISLFILDPLDQCFPATDPWNSWVLRNTFRIHAFRNMPLMLLFIKSVLLWAFETVQSKKVLLNESLNEWMNETSSFPY